MSQPGLPIQRLVSTTVNLSPPAPTTLDIDTFLEIGSSNVIDVTERLRVYDSIGAVATDFGTSAPEYLAAVLWFEQNPAPSQISIGRWAQTATAGQLIGGPEIGLLTSVFTGITSGGFYILLNGVPTSITGLNFSSALNLNGVASVVQTALNSALAGSTCVWNATYSTFTIASGTTGAASTVSFASAPTATGNASFSGQPSNNDTLTLNGTAITFVTGTPTGDEVQISGVNLAGTLTNLMTFLNSSADVQLVKFHYTLVGSIVYLTAAAAGAGGDALTIAKSSTAITLSGATLAGGNATDVSALMGLNSTSSGAYLAPGIVAETALEAVVVLDNQFSDQWYGLTVLGAADSDVLQIAAYVEADSVTRHFYGVTTQEAGVLVASDTTDIAYQLQQLAYNHTAVQYSSSNPYAVVSLLARILTTNWLANNSTITLMYKQEPGIVAESLNVQQVNALEAKNCNVFVNYNNNTAIIEMSTCASGQFIDTVIGMDWLTLTLQANWYDALYSSSTKIPQTDAGMHILATIAANTCQEAVNNGLLAPGQWNAGGFGTLNQGDFLAQGFYIFQPSVNSQPQSVRAQRQSVPFQIAVKLAGAVQTINGTILVNS